MAQMGFFDLADRYASLDAKKDPLVEIHDVVQCRSIRNSMLERPPSSFSKRSLGGQIVRTELIEAVSRSYEGRHILVAEDEIYVPTILVEFLRNASYRGTAAGTGEDALALFQANSTFDLVLTDVVMPGSLQGPELSQAIRKQAPDLPIVFMSNYPSEAIADGKTMQPEGICLMKPILRADLLAQLGNL